MFKYPITIELLSETILGNGEAKNGVVNTEILLDRNGFPYFLGKTFKGNLKNVAEEVLKPSYEKDFDNIVKSLFGDYQNEGALKFTNFYLDKDIKEVFSNDKSIVMQCLTDIRYSIKINGQGVAEDKSLRATRVLKKGLVFVGFIESEEKLEKEKLKFIKNAIQGLKHIGIHKSRGKGNVKVSLLECENEGSTEVKNMPENDFDYIFYEINLDEPVKIGDSQAKYDYEESKLYITGSSVRGAVISKYNEKDKDFNSIIRQVRFYDVYPIFKDNLKKYFSFPTPNIFRITKERDKSSSREYLAEDFSIIFNNNLNDNNVRKIKKLKKGAFSYCSENVLYQFNVKKEFRFHHSREKDKSNIFRYEAIGKNQEFYGIIDVSKITLEEKKELYKKILENRTLYLGGSRTGGYGKVKITNLESVKDFKKLDDKLGYLNKDKSEQSNMYIYFLSNTILRDENQQISSSFDKNYLNKELNTDFDEYEYEIEPTIITGFNSKWQSNLPQVYGVEAGSVIKLKKVENFDYESINKFIEKQHGDRILDGFGRVFVNPQFLKAKKIVYKDMINKDDEDYSQSGTVTKDYINDLKMRINEEKTKLKIKNYISRNQVELTLDKTQANNIVAKMDSILKTEGNYLDELKNYINEIKDTTENNSKNEIKEKILNQKIFDKYDFNYISRMELANIKEFIRCNIDKNINFNISKIFITLIREAFYYSIKQKNEGEI
ncbi:RAMP superfamily CRISPR-associated protein [Clostridium felsineum]|uniref:RAMP superfamily CRISPR-associated protein n=1 Tax=Clostridium felsineum TaxID=36839 RepID=UPI00098C3A38|nr:RAMP superfamily CRISPR-associated protein [Clostridium felsineum]URZ15114.1 hypothetical protein CLFE_011320 [Clostridium felsineum DSM 794]